MQQIFLKKGFWVLIGLVFLFSSAKIGLAAKPKTTWKKAIVTVCEEDHWVAKISYTKCLKFARKNGLFAKPLPKKIKQRAKISAKHLRLLRDRSSRLALHEDTIVDVQEPRAQEQNQSPPPPREETGPTLPPQLPERLLPTGVATPFSEINVAVDFFRNIRLTAQFKNRFYLDEVYVFEGDLQGVSAEEVFIFLCRTQQGCSQNSFDFIEKTTNGHFRVPVFFTEAGNFQLGIIPGRAGESNVVNISVVPAEPTIAGAGTQPTDLSAQYERGTTKVRWRSTGEVTRLAFFQEGVRRDYIFRQPTISFAPRPQDFRDFKKGRLYWLVQNDNMVSPIEEFQAVVQEFRKIIDADIRVDQLRETFATPDTIEFIGSAIKKVSKRAALTLPNGTVKDIYFAAEDIASGDRVSVNFDLPTTGTYIFEINNPEGSAMVNVPIYVGVVIPILPDFFALNPPVLDTAPLGDLNAARETLLALINRDRADHGLSPVALNETLNILAQGHSQNMKDARFFGHKNPAGQSPDDRRRNAGINTAIRENLGKSTSLPLTEAGLMRSPVHREAIVDGKMRRVGIGIVKDSEGYFLVTQNFSGDPLTTADLETITEELIRKGNEYRQSQNLTRLDTNPTLAEIARDWSQRMAQEDFFALSDSTGTTLASRIRARGINDSLQMNIIKASGQDILAEELVKQSPISNTGNNVIGMGLSVNSLGDIYLTAIYTP